MIKAVATLAELLLRSAPELRILATSREPLGLSGELLWPVPTLELSDLAVDGDLHAVAQCSAAQLFVQRAAAASAGFTLTESNATAVATLCRRLDGLPLALELAAARVRVLPVHELAARLDDRFRLLAAGHRDAPDRQQTLRAVVDWSWELLADRNERCCGGWGSSRTGSRSLPQNICAGDGVDHADVLDLRPVGGPLAVVAEDGGARYRLLETIAAYALEHPDSSDETDKSRLRHATWYADLPSRPTSSCEGTASSGGWRRPCRQRPMARRRSLPEPER